MSFKNENGLTKGKIKGSNAENPDKIKFALYMLPETMQSVESIYKSDNCTTKTEFMEKAIKFYIGYLNANRSIDYISPFISSIMEASVAGTEQRLSRLLFKVAVELSKLSNITAALNEIDRQTLHDLHIMCVEEVKKINGTITFEKAVKFQKE